MASRITAAYVALHGSGVGDALLADGVELAPREAGGVQYVVEGFVGHVGEPMPVAVVVTPPLFVDGVAQLVDSPNGIHIPRCRLRKREIVVGWRFAETAVDTVLCPQQHPTQCQRGGVRRKLAWLLGIFERTAVGRDNPRVTVGAGTDSGQWAGFVDND